MARKVIVIGAGVCGLTAAYRLRRQGFEPIVLERAGRLGGRTITEKKDGFINDLGGSLLATSYKEALQLADELGLHAEKEAFAGSMQIYVKGVFHTLAMDHPMLSVLRAPYLGWRSKLSLLRLLPVLIANWGKINLTNLSAMAGIDNQTAESFCRKRVTAEAYDLLLNPLTRAMYGHDCNEISIVELLWMIKTFATCSAVAFKGGMQTLPDALARGLNILTSHDVSHVEATADGVTVTAATPQGEVKLQADTCVIAADGKDLQRIYGHALSAAQNDFLTALEYNPLSMVFFTLRKRPDEKGFIVEIPRSEDAEIAAFAWYHLWGSSKVPQDKGALIFLGMNEWQFRMQDQPIEVRIADARRYARKYYPFLEQLEESAEVTPWPRATTIGRVGNYKRLRAFVADQQAASRVQYGGDYMSQSSVGTAVATGNDLAARLVKAARLQTL